MDSKKLDKYWATETPLQLISVLDQKVADFDRYVDMSGRWPTYRDLYYHYYLVNEQTYLYPNYGADAFKRININHFRAILLHLLSLVTAQRAVPQPVSVNTDYKSQAQTDFCKNILRHFEREKKLDEQFQQATETALLMGSCFLAREWDTRLGKVYGADPDTNEPQHEGDFVVTQYNPLDCIFDFAGSSWEAADWVVLRRYVNRWTLVAKFPSYEDQIKMMSCSPQVKRHRLGHVINESNDDLIPLYTFYHKKTPILPDGRMTMYLDQNTCLFDGALPYNKVPVSRIVADHQLNTPFGYTVAMDLLPLQKVYNALCSAVCTNQAAFGVQNILIPREAAISLSQLTEGLNAIYYDPAVTQGAKPEPLNLLATAPEIFKWIEYLESMMAKISGVNDTIQGDPAANLKSGTALAFVAAQALTFINPLCRSYTGLHEDTWTGIIDILKEFATTPRMILISGLNNKAEAKEFTNADLADIDRVIVESGNPLTQTLAGRIQMAQDLLQAGLLNKEEYMTVFQTGQLEPLYAYEKAELMRIKQENEALQAGKPVKAMTTDNHPLEIREHLILLNSPETRNNPEPNNPVILNTLNHIKEHLNFWTNMDPRIAALLSIPPAPGAGPQMPPQGPENPNGTKVPGAPNLPKVMNATPPNSQVAGAVQQPRMPNLPKGADQVTQASSAKLDTMIQPPTR
jgi:hypothetical protein